MRMPSSYPLTQCAITGLAGEDRGCSSAFLTLNCFAGLYSKRPVRRTRPSLPGLPYWENRGTGVLFEKGSIPCFKIRAPRALAMDWRSGL